jgi:glutathione synthase/RimK-type ligase-like ATP-grasp enzyme
MTRIVDVGVVGMSDEPHAVYLVERLTALGAHPLLIDPARGLSAGLSLTNDDASYAGTPLCELPVLYLRTLYPGIADERDSEGDLQSRYAAGRERQALWISWLRGADRRGQLVVNTVEANDLHSLKPYTTQLLREHGIPVPATLVTSDADMLRAFRDRYHEVIAKPVAGGALARLVTEEDLTQDRLAILRLAPVLFQEYIAGRDLRVYTLAGEVIASAIIHTESVDYRAAEGPVERVSLDPEAEALALGSAAATGCLFSAVDLKWTRDGRYVVLDCNPSPMFLGFDRKSGANVGKQLARFLADRSRSNGEFAHLMSVERRKSPTSG